MEDVKQFMQTNAAEQQSDHPTSPEQANSIAQGDQMEYAITPAKVLSQVALAIPQDLRADSIIAGSGVRFTNEHFAN